MFWGYFFYKSFSFIVLFLIKPFHFSFKIIHFCQIVEFYSRLYGMGFIVAEDCSIALSRLYSFNLNSVSMDSYIIDNHIASTYFMQINNSSMKTRSLIILISKVYTILTMKSVINQLYVNIFPKFLWINLFDTKPWERQHNATNYHVKVILITLNLLFLTTVFIIQNMVCTNNGFWNKIVSSRLIKVW